MEKFIQHLKAEFIYEDLWMDAGIGLLKIIGILLVTSIIIKVGKIVVQKVFNIRSRSSFIRVSQRREATLMKLLINILRYVAFFYAFIKILEVMSVEVKPLLAGAGIAGLAIGFGAQNLVRDIITGFFIIFEDQFSVGDYIRIDQFEGTVEEIGLRTTKIKSWTGEIHILPNGSINQVTNFSLTNSVAFVDVQIGYESDIGKAEKVLQELLETLPEKYEEMVKTPEILGVQALDVSTISIRVIAETWPMKHFAIARKLRKEIKLCLSQHGIEVPFPRLVLYSRGEEERKEKNSEGES